MVVHRRVGHLRRGRRAGRGGGGVRLLGGGRRDAPGPEGGHILGGTPKYMQIGDMLGILVASAVLYFPLLWLHLANIKSGGIGFGDPKLSAPQAGLMAALAQGIVGGNMAWPLVVVGIFMGLALIMVQVRSPMLFAVGMYLPLETTFAIFLGGVIRWITD